MHIFGRHTAEFRKRRLISSPTVSVVSVCTSKQMTGQGVD